MKTLLWSVGGFLAGGVLAGVIGFSLPAILPISQAEGAYAMGVAFFWVPLGAVLGAAAGVVRGLRG
jgi:NhaP-type Na+/H+ or K+/H+ antiporter